MLSVQRPLCYVCGMQILIVVFGIVLAIVIAVVGWVSINGRRRAKDRADQLDTLNALVRHIRVIRADKISAGAITAGPIIARPPEASA